MFEACVGRRELGKTTLAYARALGRPRRVILDNRSLWKPTDGRVLYGGRHTSIENFPGLALAWADAREVVIQHERASAPEDTWEWFCGELVDYLEAHPDSEWAVLVDELGDVDWRSWPMRDWNFFVRSVPRPDVDIFVTAHQPINIPRPQRSIVDKWNIFQTVDPDDLKMLARRGVPADVRAQLPTLPPFVFYEWDEARGRGVLKIDSAAWHESLTPPMVSDDRRALYAIRGGRLG